MIRPFEPNPATLKIRKPSTPTKITAIMETCGRAYRMQWTATFQPRR